MVAISSLASIPLLALGPVEFARPLFLLGIPVATIVFAGLLFHRPRPDGLSPRRRWLFFASRFLLVALLFTAAAGPYLVVAEETTQDPSVHMLIDGSDSMEIYDVDPDAVADGIEARGVPVQQTTIADGDESPIGDGVISHMEADDTVLLVSDGRVTHGRSLSSAGTLAFEHNTTISALDLTPAETARTVSLHGPDTTSAGVEDRYLVTVDGVNLGNEPISLTVSVDGEPILNESVSGSEQIEFTHAFDEPGSYAMTAEIESPDHYDENDVFRRSIRVVEPPEILYVSRVDYPTATFLDQLYNVTRAESVPDREELDRYYAVVIHDVAAGDLGNVGALQSYANDGNGVLVLGGDNSFDHGGYGESPIAHMLPVEVGDHQRSSDIVLVIDISGSAEEDLPVMQSMALDILDQTGDQNRMGIIAFDTEAHPIVEPRSVGDNRDALEDTILRLQAGGGTDIAAGLRASEAMLEDGGDVVLISDGIDRHGPPQQAARRLAERDIRVTTVGTPGFMNETMMVDIARITGGSYIPAGETTKLRLLFGDEERQFEGDQLTVVDGNHFITTGVTPSADPALANEVTERGGAQLLVATADGTPAVTAWRYGLGRVVTITTYDSDGSLGPFLAQPDAELLTRSTNWAIGDPERKAVDVMTASDGRVGDPIAVEYRGPDRPQLEGLHFSRTGENRYRAFVTPTDVGYETVGGAQYAVNAPSEYAAFGQSSDLRTAVSRSGGELFDPGETDLMAEHAVAAATREREIQRDYTWIVLAIALGLYLLEVSVRRLQEVYGLTSILPG